MAESTPQRYGLVAAVRTTLYHALTLPEKLDHNRIGFFNVGVGQRDFYGRLTTIHDTNQKVANTAVCSFNILGVAIQGPTCSGLKLLLNVDVASKCYYETLVSRMPWSASVVSTNAPHYGIDVPRHTSYGASLTMKEEHRALYEGANLMLTLDVVMFIPDY